MSANPTRHPPLDELSAWVDGEIAGEPERRLLAEHVADCPSCASLAEDFRALARAQVQAGVPAVPAHLEQRVVDALVGEARFRSGGRRFVLPLSAAATVLVGVVALWLLRHQPSPELSTALDRMEPPADVSAQTAPTFGDQTPVEPPAAAMPVPSPPPTVSEGDTKRDSSKKEAKLKTIARARQIPVPAEEKVAEAPAQEESAAANSVLGGVAQEQPAALKTARWRWTRVPRTPLPSDARQDAYAPVPESAAPEADTEARTGAPAQEPCPVLDRLEPALLLEGLDAARAGELAERARAAGATTASVETEPLPRVTLTVPAAAWPQVRESLAAQGVAVQELPAAPEGAACLVVPVQARP